MSGVTWRKCLFWKRKLQDEFGGEEANVYANNMVDLWILPIKCDILTPCAIPEMAHCMVLGTYLHGWKVGLHENDDWVKFMLWLFSFQCSHESGSLVHKGLTDFEIPWKIKFLRWSWDKVSVTYGEFVIFSCCLTCRERWLSPLLPCLQPFQEWLPEVHLSRW